MSRSTHDYPRRGCSTEIVTGADPLLIETEPDALFEHWRAMALLTLKAEPVDLGKLEYSLRRMEFWREHMK